MDNLVPGTLAGDLIETNATNGQFQQSVGWKNATNGQFTSVALVIEDGVLNPRLQPRMPKYLQAYILKPYIKLRASITV